MKKKDVVYAIKCLITDSFFFKYRYFVTFLHGLNNQIKFVSNDDI